jgi:hypothetical protein
MHIDPTQMPVRRFVCVPIPLVCRQQEAADDFCEACFTVIVGDYKSCSERMRQGIP